MMNSSLKIHVCIFYFPLELLLPIKKNISPLQQMNIGVQIRTGVSIGSIRWTFSSPLLPLVMTGWLICSTVFWCSNWWLNERKLFGSISMSINHTVYRIIHSVEVLDYGMSKLSKEIVIYQKHLEMFDEFLVVVQSAARSNCLSKESDRNEENYFFRYIVFIGLIAMNSIFRCNRRLKWRTKTTLFRQWICTNRRCWMSFLTCAVSLLMTIIDSFVVG